ncbi:hypothetical protein BGZ61DRAFT_460525 [Ilyonectria robusta]|uniref:uncharacterized protein n=1 Tax=Ilyonectria robusta TaxID=1079257 RepID=UPI001E8ED335|nr:uncharacterized protein BGZ61DRAFT_460525 [Ilyonectria robusta]KAH8670077.1 hypothetical protein BGZ61DRAFT_460525 [Ilyonectria robusta]
MLDESLPTYRFKVSSENPLNTILYFTHNGSDPSAEYLVKRPAPSSAPNQYALGLLDPQNAAVIYAEVLLKPEWTQPTLSAAEVRAGNGPASQSPVTPDTFALSLYNPDQTVPVKLHTGSWGKSDSWEFEIPERTFKLPSVSRIDQDADRPPVSELVPKLVFRWKRDGRKDMTCYMTGKTVAGKNSKEPDITVAFFRGKNDSILTIYEPNMARVEVEDRKGLEMALLLSAEVIRDLWVNPRNNPFNISSSAPASSGRRRNTSPRVTTPPGATMSGALGNQRPSSPPQTQVSPIQMSPDETARRQAEIEAETQRLKAMVAEEERQARERERVQKEERKRAQKIQEREEKERRKREAEIDKETERLRREFGMEGQEYTSPTSPTIPEPRLPPRPQPQLGVPNPGLPPRPVSVGPMQMSSSQPYFAPPPQQLQAPPSGNNGGGKKRHGLGGLFQSGGPYGGPAAATVSGFFGGRTEEDKRKKVQKKRSVHF